MGKCARTDTRGLSTLAHTSALIGRRCRALFDWWREGEHDGACLATQALLKDRVVLQLDDKSRPLLLQRL